MAARKRSGAGKTRRRGRGAGRQALDADELYRTLVDVSPDAVTVTDLEARIRQVSRRTLELHGYGKPEELLGSSALVLISPEDHAKAEEGMKRTFEKGILRNAEFRFLRKDGTAFMAELDAALVRDGRGRPSAFIAVTRDMTKHKQAEEELKRSRGRLRDLSAHLQSVREEERARIAREIHDELGQALTALKMGFFWLRRRLPESHKMQSDRIGEMAGIIDETIRTVQRISTELRPAILDDFGLASAIEWQCEEFQKRTGIGCEVRLDSTEPGLDRELSTAIFRVFQETLTNAARHSGATKVKVDLAVGKRKVKLSVTDNGRGIMEKQAADPKSFGLAGIRERMLFWGGEVTIRGRKDRGTTVAVKVPLEPEGGT